MGELTFNTRMYESVLLWRDRLYVPKFFFIKVSSGAKRKGSTKIKHWTLFYLKRVAHKYSNNDARFLCITCCTIIIIHLSSRAQSKGEQHLVTKN